MHETEARPIENIWFWSDLHFGHKMLHAKGYRKGYESIESHDALLVERWNATVGKNDRAYLLGDLSFHKPERTRELIEAMNGQLYLVKGNHDSGLFKGGRNITDLFVDVYPYKEIKVRLDDATSQRFVLMHFPILSWNLMHQGSIHVHGHSHGNLPETPDLARFDVGVDCFPEGPVSAHRIMDLSRGRNGSVDHHGTQDNL
jgi:calcineurin-like phosphoesterase family protein